MRRYFASASLVFALACSSERILPTQPSSTMPPPQALPPQALPVQGAVTFRFEADAACAARLPAGFREREYSSVVGGQAGWQLVTLSGGRFAPSSNGYPGTDWNVVAVRLLGNDLTLYLEDPPIQEIAGTSERFWIYGHVSTDVRNGTTNMPFSGYFSYCRDGERDCAECRSSAHRLTLVSAGG